VVLGLVIVALSSMGFAQVKEMKSFSRDMEVVRQDGKPVVSVSFDEVFTPRLRHRLSNGFTSRILVDIVMREAKSKTPLAQELVQYTILYDIWEEHFNVREETPLKKRGYRIDSLKNLIRRCGSLRKLPLVPLLELPSEASCQIEVRITVNPVSPELRRKVREYLSNPDGGGHIGSPRSFFGSFSRIFVSEKDIQADMVYTYRSQKFDCSKDKLAD
jgi:hypothetical protein